MDSSAEELLPRWELTPSSLAASQAAPLPRRDTPREGIWQPLSTEQEARGQPAAAAAAAVWARWEAPAWGRSVAICLAPRWPEGTATTEEEVTAATAEEPPLITTTGTGRDRAALARPATRAAVSARPATPAVASARRATLTPEAVSGTLEASMEVVAGATGEVGEERKNRVFCFFEASPESLALCCNCNHLCCKVKESR